MRAKHPHLGLPPSRGKRYDPVQDSQPQIVHAKHQQHCQPGGKPMAQIVSIIVPIIFVRPESDIPIVPILTNCIAPPMPRPKRFYEVGKAIRAAVDSLPTKKRIGVLVSGHLSLEVGGPKQFERHLTDPNFDAAAVGWIVNGDIESAAEGCTPGKMIKAGNMTSGYLNFLMMMGVANASKPSYAEGLDAGFPAIPFFSWDAASGEANIASGPTS